MKKLLRKMTITSTAIFGVVFLAGCGQNQNTTEPTTSTEDANMMEDAEMKNEEMMDDESAMKKDNDTQYADGTYSVEGAYQSPAGPETIKVSLTLENGVITTVTATPQSSHDISIKMQTAFSGGIADAVVGKNIDDAEVDVVAGSSLTPNGFNDALAKIKQQAQA